jgi:outer membrane receptor protein involved in Fe transport
MRALMFTTSLVALTISAQSFAQSAATPAADATTAATSDSLGLDEIVVTGTRGNLTKFKSSVSVSSLDEESILAAAPRSAAEIFRNLPGVRSESSGGDGNANIAVRGLPVASGGAKFLQIHEDGLPVLEYGDIAFGNADIFVRADQNIARVESIRGGSASTFASNSPGGIINFISKTGKDEGGAVAASFGIDYRDYRVDADYGTKIADSLYFHIGGFYRVGDGPRNAGYTAQKGGQIKANLTKEFENGFIRVSVKHLNDRSIGYLPMPIFVGGTNANPDYRNVVGFDAKKDTPHSALFQTDVGLDGNNNRRSTDIADGMRPIVTTFGAEANFDLDGGWNITNKIKYSRNRGRFVSPFPSEVDAAAGVANSTANLVLGTTNAAGAVLRYANGAQAGQAYTGLVMRTHLFNTEINNFDHFANDLKLTKSIDSGNGKVDVTVGYYRSSQNINMDWVWNSYLMEVKGNNAALLDVFSSTGQKLSTNGLYAYGVPFWGNCCQRNYDAKYDIDAPYISMTGDFDALTVDASLRWDNLRARGNYSGSAQAANLDVNADGIIQPNERSVSTINKSAASPINYNVSYVSWSFGANYRFADNLAAFARVSRGGRQNADRLLFGTVRADGSVRKDDAIDYVNQYEAGLKFRGDGVNVEATGFYAKTEEQNFEATTQKFLNRKYRAYGLELSGSYRYEGFNLLASATWTNARIASDEISPANKGKTPRRQASLVYQVTPSYTYDRFKIGANVIGTTKSFAQDDNQLVMPGYAQVNAFIGADITEGLSLTVNANNLFNAFGLTESEEGAIPGNGIIRGRAINGRTVSATLKYSF